MWFSMNYLADAATLIVLMNQLRCCEYNMHRRFNIHTIFNEAVEKRQGLHVDATTSIL